jgi:fructose-1,6-bisphosphatase/inositol monophosphatase family enzyme
VTDEEVLAVLHEVAGEVCGLVEATPVHERAQPVDDGVDQFSIDLAADALAVRLLTAAGFGVLSEESGRHRWNAGIRVVVDPIDGSTNCARGLPSYGPSLCAVDGDGLVAAVVRNIPAATSYAARRGSGATKNGAPLLPPRRDHLRVVATGDPVDCLEPETWTRLSGASAHDLCLVADGTVDGYVDVRNTQSIWDYAGALLVLLECGAVVRERAGRELLDFDALADRRLVAASTGQLVDLLDRLPLGPPVTRPRRAARS